MPTRETGNGSDINGIRSNFPANESLGLNPLGSITPLYPPIPASFGEDTHNSLDEIGGHIANIETKVLYENEEKLQTVEKEVNNVASVVLGSIGVGLDKVDNAIGAINKKINTRVNGTMDAMYGYMQQAGFPYPSIHDVQFSNASGDVSANLPRGYPIIHPHPSDGTPPPQILPAPMPLPGQRPPIIDPFGNPPPGNTPPITNPPIGLPPGGDGTCHKPADVARPSPDPCWVPYYHCATCINGNWGGAWGTFHPEYFDFNPGTVCWIAEWKYEQDPNNPNCQGNPSPNANPDPCDKIIITLCNDNASCMGITHPELGNVLPLMSPEYCKTLQSPTQCWMVVNKAGQQVGPKFCLPLTAQPCIDSHYKAWGCLGPFNNPLRDCFKTCEPDTTPPPPPPGETCPAVPAPPCDVNLDGKFPKPVKSGSDACEALVEEANTYGATDANISDFVGMLSDSSGLGTIGQAIAKAILGSSSPIIPSILDRVGKWLQSTIKNSTSMLDCEGDKIANIGVYQLVAGMVKQYAGFFPPQVVEILQQMSNTVCQSHLPGGGEADLAYLRGEIDKKLWECYHKAAGNHVQDAEHVMRSGRAKVDPTQLDRLYRRKFIEQADYDKLMKEAGVIEDVDKKNIHDMNQQFPTLQETALLLMRDVANEKDYDWSEADKLFADNYKGKVKEWYDANGVDEELAKYQWRAHFHIPSYSMGREFLFRIRPDEYDEENAFSLEKFRLMLIQDDWHPAYVDWMINTAYLPVSKTDSVRAYMLGSIDEDELKKRFMNVGYRPADADFYVKFHKLNRTIQNRKVAGMPTARRLVQSYARCEITESDFRDTLAKIVVTEEQELDGIDAAKIARKIENRKRAIKSIRRPYVLGIIDDSEVQELMDAADIQGECRDELLQAWTLDRMRRDKTLAAGTLCDMISRGIITADKYVSALVRNGYSAGDANAMLLLCGAKLTEKQQKAAEQLARRLQAQAEKDRKAADKARKLAECGPPDCPKNTPGGKQTPPVQAL